MRGDEAVDSVQPVVPTELEAVVGQWYCEFSLYEAMTQFYDEVVFINIKASPNFFDV